MNVLSITAALPIPGVFEDENDVTLKFFKYLREANPNVEVYHLYPAVSAPRFLERSCSRWALYNRIKNTGSFDYEGMHIRMCPYYAFRRIAWLRALTAKSLVWLSHGMEREVDIDRYDVIHAQRLFPAGELAYYLARKYKKPLIFTVREDLDLWDNWYSRRQAKRLLRRADSIASVSYNMHELLKNDGFDSQYIPHGLDSFFFDSYDRETSVKPVRMLSLCRLFPRKGIDRALLALKPLREKGIEFVYTIAGTGEDWDRLASMVEDLGLSDIVEFAGRVEHQAVPQLMKNHDIFVLPSSNEPFGLVYFEAMSQGIPIVCTKNTGIDGFFENWKSGVSVDNQDISEIENALERLISDAELRKSIGRRGQELVSQFSWEYIVKMYLAIYNDVIEE